MNKPKRVMGRLGQMNKALRLRRRALGQWKPEVQVAKGNRVTRLTLAEAEWREEQ